MQIAFTEEQDQLRKELRHYFAELMTPEVQEEMASDSGEYGGGELYKRLVRQMGHDGWLGIGWPTEYGGQNRSMIDQLIFLDEASLVGAPIPFLTINTVGPTLMQYGDDLQRKKFLPSILKGEMHFSIGYSEPGAGTDLASITTRAERDGDEWVINGQKMWTSLIQYADYVWLAARTDPDAPKHKGISMFLMSTDTPGFSWSPVPTVTGTTTSATFYDDVRIPAANLVGGLNNGWKLITNQLNHERVALCSAAGVQNMLAEVRRWAHEQQLPDGRRVIDQEWVQVHLARVHAKVEFLKLINWKIAWGVKHGLGPQDASATKVFGTEFTIEACRLLMEVLGQEATITRGSPGSILKSRIERMHRSALILTFGGGTNEVQRDIIAMVGLGMPRAPR
ncbi:acyl-CoA dehydrogenase family protein [Aquihabitans sp. G128]|uniref:acyl-CoA dehydrogenase family protein n=1 Tax=Aquihabitans sp. G128 TaxID=2849779 RepID=UPI001C2306B5|nr:acyl-CoA dehydrogenase family protein [Aquihabitans sp. G128]QXC61406.1 acyl-CoA dehydrogenase family protein [Aquihabitans sp. G128]